jgi:predicted alpha/beta superfamily hydrolase
MKVGSPRRIDVLLGTLLMLLLSGGSPVFGFEDGEEVSMVVARQFELDSKALGESRPVLVNLPRGYEEDAARYPLLIVLDGSPATTYWARASTWDAGASGFVVAAIPNVDRVRDLTQRSIGDPWPTSGGAERFLAFLTDELIPWLDARYRTTGYRIITGGSAAGRFSVFALLVAPGHFDAAIAGSPMLATEYELIRSQARECFAGTTQSEHFLFLVYGSRDYPGVTLYADRFLQLLQDEAPSWLRFGGEVLEGKGHYQFEALNAGLSTLFADSGFPTERFLAEGAAAVEPHAQRLGKKFKTAIDPGALTGERALIGAACELGRQRRFSDAVRVLEYGLTVHPESAPLVYYLAQMHEHAADREAAIAAYRRVLEMEHSAGLGGMTRIFLDELSRVGADDPETDGG